PGIEPMRGDQIARGPERVVEAAIGAPRVRGIAILGRRHDDERGGAASLVHLAAFDRAGNPVSRRSRMIRRLLILMAAAAAGGQSVSSHAKDPEQMIALNPQTLTFQPIPDMPPCASAAILRGDPRTGPAWVLLKLTSGCRVPWHWHTANET